MSYVSWFIMFINCVVYGRTSCKTALGWWVILVKYVLINKEIKNELMTHLSRWWSCSLLLTCVTMCQLASDIAWASPQYVSLCNILLDIWRNVYCPNTVYSLTDPSGTWLQSQISKFQTHFNEKYLKYLLWNCYKVNATAPHWSSVNIGLGSGFVPSGNKPLPEPMLT